MWRVLDLGGDNYYLHSERNSLVVERDGKETKIPYQDIHSITCHGNGILYSDSVFKACLKHNIPMIFCDEQHVPTGMLLALYQHKDSAQRHETQLLASLPRKKRAWKFIVVQKLLCQSGFLEYLELTNYANQLKMFSRRVQSGDPSNTEAQGARLYFTALYGHGFYRSDRENEINAKLNYGYTILRSAVARAVIAAGLHPSYGVYHSSRINPYSLVDDLMEPFRPLVDSVVHYLCSRYGIDSELTTQEKKELMRIPGIEVEYKNQRMEFSYALHLYVLDYLAYLSREKETIQFPRYSYAWTV